MTFCITSEGNKEYTVEELKGKFDFRQYFWENSGQTISYGKLFDCSDYITVEELDEALNTGDNAVDIKVDPESYDGLNYNLVFLCDFADDLKDLPVGQSAILYQYNKETKEDDFVYIKKMS